MKHLLLILGVFFCPGIAMPQSSGFIYIESEPSRPFYLRTSDSLYVSSTGNYIILAPLGQLKGEIIVGFPGRQQAAFVFVLPDTITDRGLVLRDMRQEGWRLVDWRNNEPLITRRLGRQEDEYAGMFRRNDAFALRLSQVVNDSSVLFYSRERDKKNETALHGTDVGKTAKTAIDGVKPKLEGRNVQDGSAKAGQAEKPEAIQIENSDTTLPGVLVEASAEMVVPMAGKDSVGTAGPGSNAIAGEQSKDSTAKVPGVLKEKAGLTVAALSDSSASAKVVSDSGKAVIEGKPAGALPVSGGVGKSVLAPVRLVSRKDTGKTWVLVYEVREGNSIDRVEVEIDKDRVTFAP